MASYDFHDFARLTPAESYRWTVNLIIPPSDRVVTSISEAGVVNLAPFRFFNGVCSNPPTLAISITSKPGGGEKDTLRNIRANGESTLPS